MCAVRVGKLKQHFILSVCLYSVYQREICVLATTLLLSTCELLNKSLHKLPQLTFYPQIVTNHCSIFMYMCLSHDL